MDDVKYMQTALALAARGRGYVEPNPLVGCVIVKNREVIGRGWHRKFGGAHAEINAFDDCRKNGNDPAGATMYVTLEPCSHHGKTPPCADAVVKNRIRKVIIAAGDTSEHVSGKGIDILTRAGIKVKTGICRKEARLLNPWFYKFAETGRPWVILKWAQSIDGKLAYKDISRHGRWISSPASRKDANKHRRSMQGILAGVNTVKQDNPQLTVRPDTGRQPLRIILDSKLTVPFKSRIMDTSDAPSLIVTTQSAYENNPETVKKIIQKGPEVAAVKETGLRCDLESLLEVLGKRNIQQLLVEGGPTVLAAFFLENLADEVRVYISPKIIGSHGTASITKHLSHVRPQGFAEVKTKNIDGDVRITGLVAPDNG